MKEELKEKEEEGDEEIVRRKKKGESFFRNFFFSFFRAWEGFSLSGESVANHSRFPKFIFSCDCPFFFFISLDLSNGHFSSPCINQECGKIGRK